MKKSLLLQSLTVLGLLGMAPAASAQTAIVDGATYKITHYGVKTGTNACCNVPANQALVLDVVEASAEPGAFVNQWADTGFEAAQRFVLEKQTDNSYKIRHAGTQMYLQSVGATKVKGARIEQRPSSSEDAQRWLITEPDNNGRYEIKMKNSEVVMEVGGASDLPGGNIIIWDDTNFELAQRWELTRTSNGLATKEANALALQINAYPNPLGRGQRLNLRVESANQGAAEVELFDVLGKKVHAQRTTLRLGGNIIGLTNSQLGAGVYVVRVKQGEFVQQIRVVQQ